jgi:hypothetical protein
MATARLAPTSRAASWPVTPLTAPRLTTWPTIRRPPATAAWATTSAFDPNAFTPPLTTDQRGTGFARVSGGRIDVGAFERQVTPFPFTGFFQPVDNPRANDDVVNRAKAGQAIPVKFALGGNRGLAIFKPGYPKFVSEPCDASDPQDDIEATGGSSSGSRTGPTTTPCSGSCAEPRPRPRRPQITSFNWGVCGSPQIAGEHG